MSLIRRRYACLDSFLYALAPAFNQPLSTQPTEPLVPHRIVSTLQVQSYVLEPGVPGRHRHPFRIAPGDSPRRWWEDRRWWKPAGLHYHGPCPTARSRQG